MKIIELIRYELIEIYRRRILLITGVLFLFGLQQVLWAGKAGGNFNLGLVTFLKSYWLPINLIYIPLLIIFLDIGSSDTELFKVMNISPIERLLSKVGTSLILILPIIFLSFIIFLTIGIICKVPFGYFLDQIVPSLINCTLVLISIMALGLFIGRVCKINFIRYILIILVFFLINNFYKNPNILAPFYYIDMISSTFEMLPIDMIYGSHIIILILFILLMLTLLYIVEKGGLKGLINKKALLITTSIIGIIIFIIVNGSKYSPSEYIINADEVNLQYDDKEKNNDGFKILSYDMNIDIKNNFENNCFMKIELDDKNISKIPLKLYEKLEVKDIIINNEKAQFNREKDELILLNNSGEKVLNINIKYEGIINTVDGQGSKKYFSKSEGAYLADYFEWYPKSNFKGYEKEYKLKVNSNSSKKIYSNLSLDENKEFKGKDKEIFLVMGNIEERTYNDYTFIGNIELIDSIEKVNSLFDVISNDKGNLEEKNKVILTPTTNRQYLIRDIYKDYILIGDMDKENRIFKK